MLITHVGFVRGALNPPVLFLVDNWRWIDGKVDGSAVCLLSCLAHSHSVHYLKAKNLSVTASVQTQIKYLLSLLSVYLWLWSFTWVSKLYIGTQSNKSAVFLFPLLTGCPTRWKWPVWLPGFLQSQRWTLFLPHCPDEKQCSQCNFSFSDNCGTCPVIVPVISAVYEIVCLFEILVKCRIFFPSIISVKQTFLPVNTSHSSVPTDFPRCFWILALNERLLINSPPPPHRAVSFSSNPSPPLFAFTLWKFLCKSFIKTMGVGGWVGVAGTRGKGGWLSWSPHHSNWQTFTKH